MEVKPLTPGQVISARKSGLPAFVIEAFNEELVRRFDGSSATSPQSVVTDEIVAKWTRQAPGTEGFDDRRLEVANNGWLVVGPLYEEAGWKVDWDRQTGRFHFYPER